MKINKTRAAIGLGFGCLFNGIKGGNLLSILSAAIAYYFVMSIPELIKGGAKKHENKKTEP